MILRNDCAAAYVEAKQTVGYLRYVLLINPII